MAIRFSLKRKTGTKSAIRAIVHINGKRHILSTGISVFIADWNPKREQSNSNPDINAQLAAFRKKTLKHIRETGSAPNAKAPRATHTPKISDTIQNSIARRITAGLQPNSLKAYRMLAKNIQRFHSERGRTETLVSSITTEYILAFIAWMNEQNFSSGYIGKMTKTLKTVTRKLLPPEVWANTTPPLSTHSDQIFLDPQEIKRIEDLCLEPDNRLHRDRDLFLIGCYTGLRFSDWRKLDLGKAIPANNTYIIIITPEKTGRPIAIPLSPKAKAILDKYPEGLPKISNQKFNKNLKTLAQMAGITELVEITEYRAGKKSTRKVPKWQLISSHTARRSFATNAMLAGIPITEIMKFTGHRSMSAFLQYIRTTSQDAALKYAEHPFFQ